MLAFPEADFEALASLVESIIYLPHRYINFNLVIPEPIILYII